MSRLESIKEQHKNEEYIKRDIDYYEAQEDIGYLLQRLEIAQKALQEITYSENVAAMNAIAEEALDQLKE